MLRLPEAHDTRGHADDANLVGKRVVLKADEKEGWPEETITVSADYELKKPDGFQRFLAGHLFDGTLSEGPYDQLKEVLDG